MRMTSLKPSSYLLIFILLLMVFTIGVALTFRHFEAKLLPLLLGGTILVLGGMELSRELRRKEAAPPPEERARLSLRRVVSPLVWLVGFLVVIYLLGFFIAIPLFVLAYVRWRGRSWVTAVVFALIMGSLIYGIFELGLKAQLYRGLIFGA